MSNKKETRAWKRLLLSESRGLDVPMAWAVPGCYAIYLDGRLTYIGQSENVRARLVTYRFHLNLFVDAKAPAVETPWGCVRTIVVKLKTSVRYGDWLMRERRLIRRLRPRGNVLGVRVMAR